MMSKAVLLRLYTSGLVNNDCTNPLYTGAIRPFIDTRCILVMSSTKTLVNMEKFVREMLFTDPIGVKV